MTDRGPGLDLNLLADLDAGVLDADREAQVRAAAAADPRATAVLVALAATRADLAALPEPALPAHLAARWDAALAEAQDGPAAAPGSPQPLEPRIRRRAGPARRFRLRPALVAAAVLVAVVTGLAWARSDRLPSLDGVDLATAAMASIGTTDTGELADPARRVACLRHAAAPGLAPDAPLLGGRRVEIDGEPAVLLVLGTGQLGRFHVVVVDPACGPEGGRLLRSTVLGG